MIKNLIFILILSFLLSCGTHHLPAYDVSFPSDIINYSDSIDVIEYNDNNLYFDTAMLEYLDTAGMRWESENIKNDIYENHDIKAKPKADNTVQEHDNVILPIYNDTISYKSDSTVNNKYMTNNISYSMISYIVEDTMFVGEAKEIVLTISKNIKISKVIEQIKSFNTNNIKTKRIKTTAKMIVKLFDPDIHNFLIVENGHNKKTLNDKGISEWRWDVTPLTKGKHRLKLSIEMVVNGSPNNLKVYEDFIYVSSHETIFNIIYNFIQLYWQWIFSTILIPIFLFLFKRKQKQKEK